MDKMDKLEESVLVNTTQKTELVNMKEGRREISTKTSAGIVNRDASVSYWSFFFFFLLPVTVLACVANSLNP